MHVKQVICAAGRSGYMHRDLMAIKAGARQDGMIFRGPTVTPGFRKIVEPATIISVMLLLEDGQVAFGDCADVSIRGQILNLRLDIKDERGAAYLMITHDISIARHFAERVAVMRHGVIVETGPAEEVLTTPSHPYTRQLVAAVPVLDAPGERDIP